MSHEVLDGLIDEAASPARLYHAINRPQRAFWEDNIDTFAHDWVALSTSYTQQVCKSIQNRGADYRPPPISRIVPVTYNAASESSHSTPCAISSGVPARCIGMVGLSRASRPGSPLAA
jgi:hypothetical protein